MRRMTALALSALMLGTGSLAAVGDASAQRFWNDPRDRYIDSYCGRHPRADGCYDWRDHRSRWDDRHYRDWYRRHHSDDRDNAAAAIFGLAAGGLLGATIPNMLGQGGGRDVTGHVRACQARYRSYDPSTDTFLGYDGYRHKCNL